jgi:hypothetical protein
MSRSGSDRQSDERSAGHRDDPGKKQPFTPGRYPAEANKERKPLPYKIRCVDLPPIVRSSVLPVTLRTCLE